MARPARRTFAVQDVQPNFFKNVILSEASGREGAERRIPIKSKCHFELVLRVLKGILRSRDRRTFTAQDDGNKMS